MKSNSVLLFKLFVIGTVFFVACGGSSSSSPAPSAANNAPAGGWGTVTPVKPILTAANGMQYKDLNNNGVLDPYENWRDLTPEQRADDLIARMTIAEKIGLMAHSDMAAPTDVNGTVNTTDSVKITDNVRFGKTIAHTTTLTSNATTWLTARAKWANNIQALAESTTLGIPFVISVDPCHGEAIGVTHAAGFSRWPNELGIGAIDNPATAVEQFAQDASAEYKAIGIRMALSPSADLATEPRWWRSQFTFGDDSASVGSMVAAFIRGFQGTTLNYQSVACVVKSFPGNGAHMEGLDSHYYDGRFLVYPGNNIDSHLAPFQSAFNAGVAGITPSYAILQTGSWTSALSDHGLVGSTIEQVGMAFNSTIITNVLRTHYSYNGIVLADWYVFRTPDSGTSIIGMPWGTDALTVPQRFAKAIEAGCDQFGGLDDPTTTGPGLMTAYNDSLITDAQVNASAKRILTLMFRLGLFENPYVDTTKVSTICNNALKHDHGLQAMNKSIVCLINDAYTNVYQNHTNPTGHVLPPYLSSDPYGVPGVKYYMEKHEAPGSSKRFGYTEFDTNDQPTITGFPFNGYGSLTRLKNDYTYGSTRITRISWSEYVLLIIDSPYLNDDTTGFLNDYLYPYQPLSYTGNAALESGTTFNTDVLTALQDIRNEIDDAISNNPAYNSGHACTTGDPCKPLAIKLIVSVRMSRPCVVEDSVLLNEIIDLADPDALVVEWGVTDESLFDSLFNAPNALSNGLTGTLPIGLPASDTVVQDQAQQKEDTASDGQHSVYIKGYGLNYYGSAN